LAASVPTIERFSFEGEVTPELMKRVLECRRMHDLRLKGMHLNADYVGLLLGDGRWWNDLAFISIIIECAAEKIVPTQIKTRQLRVCLSTVPNKLITTIITRSSSSLLKLVLSDCRDVTDDCMLAVSKCCPLLEELIVTETSVSDVGLIAVAQGCRSLRKLSIWGESDGVEDITDAAVIAFTQYCKSITFLDVDFCSGLTMLSLQAIIQHLPALREFYFLYMEFCTDAALMQLVEARPGLTHLRLAAASPLTDDGVVAALRKLPNLALVGVPIEDGFLSEGAFGEVGEQVTIELITAFNYIIRAPGSPDVIM
jgi:hypothetical protein